MNPLWTAYAAWIRSVLGRHRQEFVVETLEKAGIVYPSNIVQPANAIVDHDDRLLKWELPHPPNDLDNMFAPF
jgi:hypothetical protein